MKLLLIGGTGFFGKSILDSFRKNHLEQFSINEIVVVSRSSKDFKNKYPELINSKVTFFDADISKCKSLPDFDVVIHAATSSDKRDYISDENKQLSNIENGASNFIKLIKQNSKKVKVLYCSSGAVYGQQPKNINSISESFDFLPLNSLESEKRIYAQGKRKAEEKILELSSHGFNCLIARCFSFYGKYLPKDQHFAYGNFVKMAEQKKDIVVKAKNRVYRSYMSADDLVLSLFILLKINNEKTSIFNVGSSQSILIHDLAKKIALKYNVKVIKNDIDETLPVDRYVPNVSKLKHVRKIFYPNLEMKTL
ncbi:NAD(P)-dependent oxidoreductase [Flavobacteriaceae bacterium]|nr:NAD(P)-dependent oxidoreductase [Flavobacteriaceae bacterium]MDB9901545.1 NAD(P)-dependent oxidoreductase [Flavobacteriaceae bacterium]MDC0958378.1 NAD(P)-dependent oxidoreductase [Flavobacteriaceae bacterium]